MNGRYLLAFGQNFILPMVNTSLIKRIFSNVSMSVKFCNFLCHKCTWCSWQHLNQPNLLVRAVFRFHVYFHVRLVLHDLGIFLAHKDGFGKVKISYIKIAYYSICDDYGVNADETWMHGDWFYTTGDGIFRYEVKVTKTTPPDNLKRWIITQSKDLARKGIEKISRSVSAYVYLVLTSQIQARSSIVGNSSPAVDDAQQVFKSTFKAPINRNYSIGIKSEMHQRVLERALPKVHFSVGLDIYMLPSNLNLNIGKK